MADAAVWLKISDQTSLLTLFWEPMTAIAWQCKRQYVWTRKSAWTKFFSPWQWVHSSHVPFVSLVRLAVKLPFDCIWLYPLDRRPCSQIWVSRWKCCGDQIFNKPLQKHSLHRTGCDVVGMNWRSVIKTCHLVEFVSNVLLKSQVLAVVSNDMMFLPGPRRRHYMPHNKKRFGCKSPWGNQLVSRRNRAWAAHEKRRKALATRWLCLGYVFHPPYKASGAEYAGWGGGATEQPVFFLKMCKIHCSKDSKDSWTWHLEGIAEVSQWGWYGRSRRGIYRRWRSCRSLLRQQDVKLAS